MSSKSHANMMRSGSSMAELWSLIPWKKKNVNRQALEVSCLTDDIQPLAEALRSQVIGQDAAIDTLICSFSRLQSGLRDPARPLLTTLLLGPTGVGKTETARALAQTLFGSERALTRINCEEYSHGHELSKLLGSPPGYVGHDIEPLLSQARIDAPHQRWREESVFPPFMNSGLADKIAGFERNKYVSIILFDEIEKAHPVMWNALLGILEDGILTLGNNSRTDFTRSIILMTSNVGSREMSQFLESQPMGFGRETRSPEIDESSVRQLATNAAKKMFPYEFLNRFDEVLIYSSLKRQYLELIFEKFLTDIIERTHTQAKIPLIIQATPEAKQFIIDSGTDIRFGARPLRRAMERLIVDPLSRFIASGTVSPGDSIEIELESGKLLFFRKPRPAKKAATLNNSWQTQN